MDKAYTAYRFVIAKQDVIGRGAMAALLVIPGAFLLTMMLMSVVAAFATLLVGSEAGPSSDTMGRLFVAALLFVWAVLLCWATYTDDAVRTATRTIWAFSAGGFLLPVAGTLAFFLAPPDPPDPIFSKGFFLVASIFFGLFFGGMGLGIAKMVAPKGSPEQSVLYVFRPAGGVKVVLAVGLLLTARMVLHFAGWEGLLN